MDLEAEIHSLRAAGDLNAAATRAIEGYGNEVFTFLVSLMRSETDAADVFSQASEDLWISLPRFEGRASLRAWFYTLARHAASRFRRSPHRRPGRHTPISQARELAERVRTTTQAHLRTDVKDQIAQIRDALDPDDRALLVLRVDRAMEWNDIAAVMEPEGASDTDLVRAAARLRKRFQLVKEEIRVRAKQAGLLPDRN